MQKILLVAIVCGVAACGPERRRAEVAEVLHGHDSVAAITADSIVALDPAREVAAAIERGDLRPVGVCGFACLAVGITPEERTLVPTDSLRIVPGTGDAISGPGMARLNAVADTFATQYNRLLIKHLKTHPAPRSP